MSTSTGKSSQYYLIFKRFDPVTGVVDTWQSLDEIDLYFDQAFDVLGNYLYVGGQFLFYTSGSYFCRNLVRINLNTGYVDTTFCLSGMTGNNWVEEVLTYNNKLYVAGSFTNVGGYMRKGVFEMDINGNVTSLDFHCSNSQNYALFPQGNTMWVGGNSANIGAGMSYRIAQVRLSDGFATCWSTLAMSSASFRYD